MDAAIHTGVCSTDIDVVFILSQCFFLDSILYLHFPSGFILPEMALMAKFSIVLELLLLKYLIVFNHFPPL